MACETPSWLKTRQLSEGVTDRLITGCLVDFSEISLAVTGRCMMPSLREGQRVRLDGRRPRIGDVVLVRQPSGLVLHRLVWGPPLDFGGAWRTMADRAHGWDARFAPSQWMATLCRPDDVLSSLADAGRAALSLAIGLSTRIKRIFSR